MTKVLNILGYLMGPLLGRRTAKALAPTSSIELNAASSYDVPIKHRAQTSRLNLMFVTGPAPARLLRRRKVEFVSHSGNRRTADIIGSDGSTVRCSRNGGPPFYRTLV